MGNMMTLTMTNTAVTWLIILISFLFSRGQALCPVEYVCSCEQQPQGLVINCRDRGFTEIPVFQNKNPNELFSELTLQNNLISSINDNAFNTLRLNRLLLNGNPIVLVSNAAFSGLQADLTEMMIELKTEAEFPLIAIQPLTQLVRLEVFGYGKPRLPSAAISNLTNLEILALTSGGLQQLDVADFNSQQNQLLTLDLGKNQFTEIPVAAISPLKRLTMLKLNENFITVVKASSFVGLSQLQALDLSRNSLSTIEINAFRDLENILQNLTLPYCHLHNQHLESLQSLTALTKLDISGNYITSIDRFLINMKSLKELNLASNQITSVTRSVWSVYRDMSSSLQKLDLSSNPIIEVTSNAFNDLTQLQELYLDGADGLQLDENSFQSQQNSLKLLSFHSANLSSSQWTFVNNLTSLRTLWMSDCKLGNIPDFTFYATNQVENLDLAGNRITQITQRSLTGLEYSLTRLSLARNQLTTLGECVFYRFTKINILALQLNSNPLRCDCDMRWLHNRLQDLRNNPNSTLLVNNLRWTCDNGRLFNNLTDADFSSCQPSTTACEEFVAPPTTVPTTSVITNASNEMLPTKSSNIPIILGVCLGVGIPLVLLVAVIIVISIKKSRRKGGIAIKSPTLSGQTKRFIKPSEMTRLNSQVSTRPSSPPQASSELTNDEQIVHTIETMSDKEKSMLIDLLRNSRQNLDTLDDDIVSPGFNASAPFHQPFKDKHVYEEIQDGLYEEIPTDDTV